MPDPHAARSGRPGRLSVMVTALLAAAMLASACSVIPAGNGPQAASVPGPPAGGGPCCGLLVRPPQVGWQAPEVVSNFLLASAIVAHNYQAAREYLTGDIAKTWHPGAGVTILASEPALSVPGGRGITGQAGKQSVLVTGQELARLSSTGQYIPSPGGAQAPTEEFTLRNVNGILKIAGLTTGSGKPSRELLLTNDLFRLVYAPRNLYYLGGRNGRLLPTRCMCLSRALARQRRWSTISSTVPADGCKARRTPLSPRGHNWLDPYGCSPVPPAGGPRW